ncbi:rhodanese-like domain-containing protein [Mesoplasma seiffertii]|uniref:rhodanese-like domain-containing protein n=1 Tax=Mesoplasma seiffertii TaxID=28224 RepID=UPI00047AC4B8|nr:rhodanese-like domain-containing protein [Mesoplasma seiffertii]
MVKTITWDQLEEYLAKDFILVDIREQYETNLGVINNCQFLPMSDLVLDFSVLDKQGNYLFYCQTSRRSQALINNLLEQGFNQEQIINIAGGYNEWQKLNNLKK